MMSLRQIIKLLIEQVQMGLVDRYKDAIDASEEQASQSGWSIFDYEEVGPGTIIVTFERMDRKQPQAPQKRSVTEGDLRALENAIRNGWGQVTKNLESVSARDSGAARVEAVVVIPERTGEISWSLP